MFTKDEVKEIKQQFWDNFKAHCKSKKVRRRWLLRNISVPSSQLKFDANREFAIVGIQIDDRKIDRKYLIFSYWEAYKVVLEDMLEEPLTWEKDYLSNDNRFVGMAYFKLDKVDILKTQDHEKIYDFFIAKMTKLEEALLEIQDSIVEGIKNKS